MIDYVGGPNGSAYGRLVVSDYYGNGTNGGVAFLDQTSGNIAQYDYYLNSLPRMGTSPDIVVGNTNGSGGTNPLTDYIVAAAYVTAAGSNPQIDYYLVHYSTPGTYIINMYNGDQRVYNKLFVKQ
jgi:hypothetical protein